MLSLEYSEIIAKKVNAEQVYDKIRGRFHLRCGL